MGIHDLAHAHRDVSNIYNYEDDERCVCYKNWYYLYNMYKAFFASLTRWYLPIFFIASIDSGFGVALFPVEISRVVEYCQSEGNSKALDKTVQL